MVNRYEPFFKTFYAFALYMGGDSKTTTQYFTTSPLTGKDRGGSRTATGRGLAMVGPARRPGCYQWRAPASVPLPFLTGGGGPRPGAISILGSRG